VVSLISLPGDDAGELAAIAMNAALFGLHTFCSEGIIAENGELLGSLEMYSGVPRSPSAGEVQFIERAKCLAAIAIEHHNEAGRVGSRGVPGNRPARGRVLDWPTSMN
jgi:GAF domain-containing protein